MGISNLIIKATLKELEFPLNKIISQNLKASHFWLMLFFFVGADVGQVSAMYQYYHIRNKVTRSRRYIVWWSGYRGDCVITKHTTSWFQVSCPTGIKISLKFELRYIAHDKVAKFWCCLFLDFSESFNDGLKIEVCQYLILCIWLLCARLLD